MRRGIVCGLFVLLLCACANGTAEPAMQQEPEVEITEIVRTPYAVREVTDTFAWIGQTPDALGIGQSSLDDYGHITFTGDLFGHTVTGTAYTETDFSDPERSERVREIWLTDTISEMQTTEAALFARFGDPYATYEEPYVESNGGVTFHRYYWTGEGVVKLSNGAKNSYYTFSYSVPDEVPEEIRKRAAGLTAEELGHRTGVYFHFAEGEAEDLKIDETAYEGYEAYLVTFTHEGVEYRVTIVPNGEALYNALPSGAGWIGIEHELQKSRLRVGADGSGTIYETNAFAQCWIVETDGPVTDESLSAFEDFLLNRWLY
jgi:hypothetical protein